MLSRKPVIAKRDFQNGATSSLLDDDDDDDDTVKEVQLTPEEMRAKQRRDREEKQRRYEEARAKIFGESNPSSGASSPGAVTPPSRPEGGGHFASRGRGRGRGGGGGYRNNNENRQNENRQFDSPRRSQHASASGRELYDPNYAPGRPTEPQLQKRTNDGPAALRTEQNPIRAPRGPDGSGRGGFGFARRGAKES